MKYRLTISSLTVVALLGLAPSAMAGQPFNWTGFYIGAEGGGSWGHGDETFLGDNGDKDVNGIANPTHAFVAPNNPDSRHAFDLSGGLIGGHVGYMDQMGGLVLGLDGAWDWSKISGTRVFDPNANPVNELDIDLNSLATINGRLGVANGHWLAYATGGIAFANENVTHSGPCGGGCAPVFSDEGSAWKTGWDAGAGIAFAVTDSIIIGAEYLHADFGSTDISLNDAVHAGSDFVEKRSIHTAIDEIKANITWKLTN